MKRVYPLLASAQLAFGQATIVSCFDEEHEEGFLDIGIVPVEDYQKAVSEIDRLKRELDVALRGQAATEKVGLAASDQRKIVEDLRSQLKAARQQQQKGLQKEQANFFQREKAIVEKVNAMERERAQVTQDFQKRVASLQANLGRKQGEWEKKLMFVEEQRDGAIRELDELKLTRMQDHKAWEKSVAKWQKEVKESVRVAQVKAAQESVANTARLAADWQFERKGLEAQIVELERKRAAEKTAWEKSVVDWQKKASETLRTTRMKEAQEAVANTARLAASWQAERGQLEKQVQEMSVQLSQLEGQLGVKGFEDKQADALRLGLVRKSKALEDLGSDAARLAQEWKAERENSRRELDAMRNLYKSTAKDVRTRDQRLKQLNLSFSEKDDALNLLATEASKLSDSWKVERGGLQKKIGNLEKQLSACLKKLEVAVKKEKAATKKANDPQMSVKLKEQLAVAAALQGKLSLTKKNEGKLQSELKNLKVEVEKLKKEMADYKSQKEKDAQALAALKKELKQVKERFATAERDLAAAEKALKSSRQEANDLKAKSQEIAGQLDVTRKELQAARKQVEANQKVEAKAVKAAAKASEAQKLARQEANNLKAKSKEIAGQLDATRKELEAAQKQVEANQKVKAEVAAKENQVKNLESQLGRLAVAQQELEGTLITTLGDFEKLQKSYIELKAKSAGGGEAASKAMAARKIAESELQVLQEKLQGEQAKLKEAKKQVQELEKKRKAAEVDAEAGKAALGKREAELKESRRQMGELQLGQEILLKEAEALRERFVSIEPVRYQLASANVVAQQQRVLAEVKQVMEVYPNARFTIRGHTCNLGREEANLKLSEDRALVLREFLVTNGIENDRFSLVEGCGDTLPQASNETDEGRRQNRRVEIEVVR